jgi:hypothetical protein
MSTDREQWIRELFKKCIKEHKDPLTPATTFVEDYAGGSEKYYSDSVIERFIAALSPPQAVDEKGIREALSSLVRHPYRGEYWYKEKSLIQWLQSQCPAAPQGDSEFDRGYKCGLKDGYSKCEDDYNTP